MKMKATALMILAGFAAASVLTAAESPFQNDKEKASYAIGVNVGSNWKRQDVEVDYDTFLRGLKDAMEGRTPLLDEQAVRDTLGKFQQELQAKQAEKRRIAGEKNKAEGEAFLAENKNKPGVVTLESGLQYKVITEGDGEIPKPEDTVTVHYRGTLVDGTEFDSSAKTGQPASFRANGVIRGWTEALTRMKAGSKWQLFIPSDLAYGEFGRQPSIGPNATLLFDVELVSVQPPPPPPPPAAPLTSDIIKVPSAEEMKRGAKIETIKAEDVERLQREAAEAQKKKEAEAK